MIRVGPSSSFNTSFNSFHSTSGVTAGFWTNGGSSDPPPSLTIGFGLDKKPLPPLSDGTTFFLSDLGLQEGQVVKTHYLELGMTVDGILSVPARGNAYTGTVRWVPSEPANSLTVEGAPGKTFNHYLRFDTQLGAHRAFYRKYDVGPGESGLQYLVLGEKSFEFIQDTDVEGQFDLSYMVDAGNVKGFDLDITPASSTTLDYTFRWYDKKGVYGTNFFTEVPLSGGPILPDLKFRSIVCGIHP